MLQIRTTPLYTSPISQLCMTNLQKKRPDICAPVLNVTHYEAGQVSPGYLFVAPMHLQTGSSSAPYIYDGFGVSIPLRDSGNTDMRM